MNIILFEIKAQWKGFCAWSVSLLIILVIFMTAIYPVFYNSLEDVLQVLKGFPPGFAEAFGFDITSMFDYEGFYSFAFAYIGLGGAVMAVTLSVATFAKEKRSKCTDFLLTKPASRKRIFFCKLMADFIFLLAANFIFFAAAVCLYWGSKEEISEIGSYLLGTCSLFFTQIVFLSFGIAVSVFMKKIRSISGMATAIGFIGFLMSALVNLFHEEALRFVAPLKYFDPGAVFLYGTYEAKYAVTGIVVILVCVGLAYVGFCSRDVHAV